MCLGSVKFKASGLDLFNLKLLKVPNLRGSCTKDTNVWLSDVG